MYDESDGDPADAVVHVAVGRLIKTTTSARRGGGEGEPGRAFAGELARIPSPRCPMGDEPALTRSVIVVVVSN